jgi:hypothetical protein
VVSQGPAADAATGQTLRASVTYSLEPGRDRLSHLHDLLADVLAQWRLPERADRYAAAAAAAVDGEVPLELFVQLDRVSQLLTLELWASGQFLFGLDDWVG